MKKKKWAILFGMAVVMAVSMVAAGGSEAKAASASSEVKGASADNVNDSMVLVKGGALIITAHITKTRRKTRRGPKAGICG